MWLLSFLVVSIVWQSTWGKSFYQEDHSTVAPYHVKIGLMMPNVDTTLKYRMGFATTASAASIALERVHREQLLPGAIITLVFHLIKLHTKDHLITLTRCLLGPVFLPTFAIA